jgi:vesicle-fusing ATPase
MRSSSCVNCSRSLDDSCAAGELGTSSFHRRWAALSLNETVSFQFFEPQSESGNCYLGKLKLEIGFLRKTLEVKDEFDTNDMAKAFVSVR